MKNFIRLTGIIVLCAIVFIGCASTGGSQSSQPAASTANYYQSGIAALNALNFDQAIADFNQAVSNEQNNVQAHFGLAYSYAFKDEWGDVTDNILMAITSLPIFIEAYNQRIYEDFRDDYFQTQADFEDELKIDLSGIKEDMEMSEHFALQDGARILFMNEAEEE